MLITVTVFTELLSEYPYANTLFESNGISHAVHPSNQIIKAIVNL